MARFVVMHFPRVAVKVPGLKMVEPPMLSFKVEIDLPEIEKDASKDPLLQSEFKNQARKILDQTVKTIEQKCKVFDGVFVQMVNKGATKKDMEKQLNGLNDAIKDDMKVAEKAAELGVQKTWAALQTKRKEWKKFKIKVFASISGTIAGLAVSIAAMATSPWSGRAGAAFAIIGFIKAGVSLASDISKIAMNINQAHTALVKNIQVVTLTAKNKGVLVGNEVSAAVFQEFLGISQPSIKTCDSACDTLKAKYAQMVVKVHDLAKTLEKILGAQKKFKREFMAEATKKLKAHPTTNKKSEFTKIEKALDAALDKNYKQVDLQIEKVRVMYMTSKDWEKPVRDLEAEVNRLKQKDLKGLKVFREALKLSALALSPIDGNGLASTAKDLGMGLGGAVGSYAYDKITSKALDGTVFDVA